MIPFHRFLIVTALLFCAGLSAWSFAEFRRDGGGIALGMGLSFALAALVLAYYLRNLQRFLGR